MASITLNDGRTVQIVKPHIGDQMELERQMRSSRKSYGAKDFNEDLKLASFQTAFVLFATFNRAGIPTTIHEVLELDLEELSKVLKRDAGEGDDESPDDESEGEESLDPQPGQTGDDAAPS